MVINSTGASKYSSLNFAKDVDMPVGIKIVNKFLLNQIKTVNNTKWLKLPVIDLIHEHDDPANIIRIDHINCTIKGNPLELRDKIQQAYNNYFNNYNYPIPFYLDSLLRFSPYCKLDRDLPIYANYFLGVKIDYIEQNSNVSESYTKSQTCNLFYKKTSKGEKMLSHGGWIAIDFGTSNSTVTFYDPKEAIEPNELSLEQKDLLFKLFKEWLGSSDSKLPGVGDHEWQEYIEQVENNLGKSWPEIIDNKKSSILLEGIRQLEISLGTRLDDPIYPVVSKKLNEIYRQLFQLPPLQKERIVLAKIDKNLPQEIQITSELELVGVNGFLEVEMGEIARNNRLAAMSQETTDENQEDENQETFWRKIESKFHHSPKRYLNKTRKKGEEDKIKIYWEGEEKNIEYSELIQAAMKCLIELTENFKDKPENKKRYDSGKFYRVIVTYPTVSKPETRRKLEELVSQILEQKFTDTDVKLDVKKDFDEAIAAAIFYVWREFGGNQTIGIEAFKTRCRRSGQKWAQNLMVLDIGGGTTDLALIRLLLRDDSPFDPGEDRGAGGRYYVLTPELMGSSGHLFLGGELITLRLFRVLKVAIVDNLLTAFTEGNLKDDKLDLLIRGLEPRFLQQDNHNKYRTRSLLECIDKENPENDPFYSTVLNYAEEILPTRWKENRKKLQAFYTLWRWADDAKVELSKGSLDYDEYEIPANQLEQFLRVQQDIELGEYNPGIKLSKQQLETAASKVVGEAINIAKDLLESRLPKDSSTGQKEPLDWLILSGQTCHLDLVRRKINEIFSNTKNDFEWNPARITFVPDYAKLATSVGACYGMSRQQFTYAPKAAKDKLKEGKSELYIEVNNLLYTLPCAFLRQVVGSLEPVFQARQPLYKFNPNQEAKARSKWFGVLPTTNIYRRDFESQREILWAKFNFEEIAKQIGIYSQNNNLWFEGFKAQFEVNQTLEIEMVVCRGKPHYLVGDQVDDNNSTLTNINQTISEELKTRKEELEKANIQEEVPQAMIIDSELQWDIAIGINEESPQLVFKAGEKLDDIFHNQDEGEQTTKETKGAISKDENQKPRPLPAFPRSGTHTFYAYYPSLESPQLKEIYLGTLGFDKNQIQDNCRYYITIDDQSNLRIHEGEVPYWISDQPEVLKEKDGCVLRVKRSPIEEENNDEQNPFSGVH
ncbi:hypothetical protein BJP34_04310 [Moorena producens PAL-8-15-08-1]|uniref:Molecular chaperone n=1 Tax=Moorena producens PAL-8-15-08-1 TaxID=1458985 RepID=A0A1D8TM92_9CYAN|nr:MULTISPECIES: virulence factor SrfB [Moorena]AOW98778.1 hypothetical protein BJP34_04310 [Moorena producens PAL-8-15-08-1]NEO77124.1 hypothetical protein [Moorena sp. SIO4G3]